MPDVPPAARPCPGTASGRLWLASLALTLPAAWPYLVHYAMAGDLVASGFIHGDMAYYMANAREHFDAGSLTIPNSASPSYDAPHIYFQPWTLLLGIVWRVTGLDPGPLFLGFGFVAGIAFVRVAVGVYQKVVGLRGLPHWLGLIAFLWGGGVLVLAGVTYTLVMGDGGSPLRFDPDRGWWFLNLGRNLVYPTEAFFHMLFFGCILAVLYGRFRTALVLAFAASISHPFTGTQLLLILVAWSLLERYFLRSGAVSRSFVLGCSALLALHFAYYLGFLSLFPDHRALVEHWAEPWTYQAKNFVPAYLLVGGLALWRMRRIDEARDVLREPRNRLFFLWCGVSFLLANHEFAMTPVQPLHFTRGYVWTPLFLLGAPVLVQLLGVLLASRRRVLGFLSAGAVLLVFLSDNAAWFASFHEPLGVYHSVDERELFDWLDQDEHLGEVLLAENSDLAFHATAYTPVRAWHGHFMNTPHPHDRLEEAVEFFRDGVFLDEWRDVPLLIVYRGAAPAQRPPGVPADLTVTTRFQNGSFTVVEVTGP